MNIAERFSHAAGFDTADSVLVITTVTLVLALLWACWTVLGQFQLWLHGDPGIGSLFFGALRVVFVLFAVSWLLTP